MADDRGERRRAGIAGKRGVLGTGAAESMASQKEEDGMEIIGLGAALGMLFAAACVMCYRKGVRDGMKRGESPSQSFGLTAPGAGSPKSGAFWGGKARGPLGLRTGFGNSKTEGDDEAAVMMRRYEAILSYDPYGTAITSRDGERV